MLDGLRQLLNAEELPEGGRKAVETRARFKLQGDSFGVFVDECSELEASAEADKTRFTNLTKNSRLSWKKSLLRFQCSPISTESVCARKTSAATALCASSSRPASSVGRLGGF